MVEKDPEREGSANRVPRVALVALHNVRNYGSVLQTLATQELIEEAGAQCSVVDFRREGTGDDAASGSAGSRCARTPLAPQVYSTLQGREVRRRSLVFRDFLRRRVHLTSGRYSSFDDLDRLPVDDYDVYCVGSDQVWNIERNRDNRPFYLSFLPEETRRFSFASLIGMAALPESEERRARVELSRFSGLSVGEARAYDYLMSLGLRVEQHVDPTLAVSAGFWGRVASAPVVERPYIAVYQLNRNPLLVSAATRMARRTGLPVVRVDVRPTMRILGARRYVAPSVEDFLSIVRNASFVVTDSFHGAAFSHIFETQFIAVPPPRYSGRPVSLLHLLGTDRNLVDSIDRVDEAALRWGVLSYDRERLAHERRRALTYLRSQVCQ